MAAYPRILPRRAQFHRFALSSEQGSVVLELLQGDRKFRPMDAAVRAALEFLAGLSDLRVAPFFCDPSFLLDD